MKVFKNPIFMFILGVFVSSGFIVFAEYIVSADKIEYAPNVSVKDKIDDLYTKIKPAYTGNTTVTPSKSTQTLNTNNKLLNSNITINPIPSTYKNLTTVTDVTPDNLLSNVKAYTNDGTLVTGNISVNCIKGSYNKPANTYISINLNFLPSMYLINFTVASGNKHNIAYNSNYSSDSYDYIVYTSGSVANQPTLNAVVISNNKIVDNSGTTTARYTDSFTVEYIACK